MPFVRLFNSCSEQIIQPTLQGYYEYLLRYWLIVAWKEGRTKKQGGRMGVGGEEEGCPVELKTWKGNGVPT